MILSVRPLNSMKTIIFALLVLGTMLVQAEEKLYDEALAKKAVAGGGVKP